uniref:Uncharacterized protein n=1 Tax=Arion vulgaris TaxID=1028688 RepID=A0A0B7BEH3_9EUPU
MQQSDLSWHCSFHLQPKSAEAGTFRLPCQHSMKTEWRYLNTGCKSESNSINTLEMDRYSGSE